MLNSKITIVCAILALAFTTNANAQGCGCGGATAIGGYGGYGSYGAVGVSGLNDCGRDYSNQQAASLWAGYCTESCVTGKKSCGLLGKKCRRGGGAIAGLGSKFGYPGGGGCGCSQGCFGYPCGGCGCGGGGCGGGISVGRGFGHGGGCRGGGCGGGRGGVIGVLGKINYALEVLKGRAPAGGYGSYGGHGGCGLFSKLKCRKTRYAAIVSYPVTTVAVDQCGCGNSGQYFDYAVGAEYGTAGMQSSISGSLTGACSSCGTGNSVFEGGYDAGMSMDAGMNVDTGIGMPAYDSYGGAAPMIEQGASMIDQGASMLQHGAGALVQ